MNLTENEIQAAYFSIGHDLIHRRSHGITIPATVQRLHDRLDRIIRGVDPDDTPDPRLADDEIGTIEAAAILGCSDRRVRRLVADLDGIKIGRTWVFNRRTVAEYAHARTAA